MFPFKYQVFDNFGGMRYFVKAPGWLQMFYPRYIWKMPGKEKIIYLTFDDGPHPEATPMVLEELKKFGAKATFFCIGENVKKYPAIYQRILDEGHNTGNHTHQHLNGWKTKDEEYLKGIAEAAKLIDSTLFRPPYGRIRSSQAKRINEVMPQNSSRIIMWSVLSGDFDERITAAQCLSNVNRHTKAGSIVVFHDSEKALPRLAFTLPRILEEFSKKGYSFGKIEV